MRKHNPHAGVKTAKHVSPKDREDANQRQRQRFLHTGSPRWRAIRKQQLQHQPLCEDCSKAGRITEAREVDHVNQNTADNTPGNLASLCKPCHSRRTAAQQRGVKPKPIIGLDGAPEDWT